MSKLVLSTLPKTWLMDVDGVVFVHNSHLEQGDILVRGIKQFLNSIPKHDKILLLSARDKKYKSQTIKSLKKFGIRYDKVLFGLPVGERILINDKKPSGLITAKAVNVRRDKFVAPKIRYIN